MHAYGDSLPEDVRESPFARRFSVALRGQKMRVSSLAGPDEHNVALAVVASAQGSAHGWTSPQCVLSFVAGVAVLTIFLVVERRSPEPLVRLGLFRSSTLRMANLVSLYVLAGLVTVTGVIALASLRNTKSPHPAVRMPNLDPHSGKAGHLEASRPR